MTVDREKLIAFADGELSEIERARVEKAIAADPALAQEVEAHRRLRARLAAHYAPVADEPPPVRLTALLEEKIVPIEAARERRAARFAPQHWAAIAATLVLGLVIGGSWDRDSDSSVAIALGGRLERALDTQLASAQPPDAGVRIGLSFRSTDGAMCRTFQRDSLAGIACNEGGEWRLRRASWSPSQDTQYRQASSAEMMAAAQEMMAGEPLDAQAEKAARERGWR